MNSSITLIGYLVLVALGVALWLGGWLWPERLATVASMIDRLTSRRRTRIAVIAIWWWLGWHFFSNVSLASVVS